MATIFDGMLIGLPGGMDAYRNPGLLPPSQCARALNVSFRGSLPRTRPGLVEEVLLPGGIFQGSGVWSLPDPLGDCIVYVASGHVYVLMLDDYRLWDMGDRMDHRAQCFIVQADKYLIVQDAVSPPFILEFTTVPVAKVPDTRHSVPTGHFGIYTHGRLHMVPTVVSTNNLAGDTYLLSGDICEPWNPETVLRFTETQYLNEGGAHALPATLGPITALAAIRNASTGTGVGSTIVFARHGVCSFEFSLPRDTGWKSQQLSQVMFFDAGSESPWSPLNANSDLLYRSADGLRTISYSTSQASGSGGALSNVPVSTPVDVWLGMDNLRLAWASTTMFSNRALMTTASGDAAWFRGMVSWDLAAGQFAGGSAGAAYDGLWTGDRFHQVISARRLRKQETFVFADGPCLLRLDETATDDSFLLPRDRDEDVVTAAGDGSLSIANAATEAAVSQRIISRMETRTYNFEAPNTLKRLEYIDLFVSGMVGPVDFEVYFKPHLYPKWFLAASRVVAVPDDTLPQGRRRLRFSVPETRWDCDPSSGDSPHAAIGIQVAVRWEGHAVIERLILGADLVAEEPPQPCDGDILPIPEEAGLSGRLFDDFEYVADREPPEVDTYSVTYLGNGHESGGVGSQVKLEDVPLVLRTAHGFRRAGFEIVSWNTLANGSGTEYALGETYEDNADLVLYAQWELRAPYTITYDINGADGGEVPPQFKEHDVDVTLRTRGTLYRGGFLFGGWNTDPSGLGTDYAEGTLYETNDSLVLYAKWVAEPWYARPQDYSIVLIDEAWPGYVAPGNVAGASWVSDVNLWNTYMEDYDPEHVLLFDLGTTSWLWPSQDSSLAAPYNTPPIPVTNITSLNRLASATVMRDAIVARMQAEWGADILTTPERIHFHVDASGSMTRGTVGDALDLLQDTLDANNVIWRESSHTNERWIRWLVPPLAPLPSAYNIFYDTNGADSGVVSAQVKEHGVPIILRGVESMLLDGHTCTGWNTESDGSGTHYDLEGEYTANAEVTLYAEWEPDTYAVSYDDNGADSGTAPEAQEKTHGVTLVLADNTGSLVLADHTLTGWNTESDGSGTHYDLEGEYTANAEVTLYAEWTAD